jgi:hypothetical protein
MEYNNQRLYLGGGDRRACVNWTMCVFGLRSRAKLYGNDSRLRKRRNDETSESVLAWFHELILTADKMPDTLDYMLPAQSKKDVFGWYMSDVAQYPTAYTSASKTYYNTLWRKFFPYVKLRKYLRFTKVSARDGQGQGHHGCPQGYLNGFAQKYLIYVPKKTGVFSAHMSYIFVHFFLLQMYDVYPCGASPDHSILIHQPSVLCESE